VSLVNLGAETGTAKGEIKYRYIGSAVADGCPSGEGLHDIPRIQGFGADELVLGLQMIESI